MLYRRIRYLLRLYWAIIVKYRFWELSAVVIVILGLSLPRSIIRFLPAYRPTQTIGIVGRYNITNLPLSIQKKISLGLTALDPQGYPVAGLADNWIATDSGLLYQFFLNPRIRWSDGKPIQARDLNISFSDAQVSLVSDRQIDIRLQKYPYSPLPVLVSRPLFKKNPFVGAGVYKVKSFHQRGDSLTDVKLVPVDRKSPLPILYYRFYANTRQAVTAFKLGEINTIESVSDPLDLNNWPNLAISQNPNYDKLVSVIFNYRGKYFAGPAGRNFRMALNYAIDRSDFPYPAIGSIPPNSWAYSAKTKSFSYDLDKSLAFFQKVDNPPSEITLYTFPGLIETAEKIKASWSKLGLSANIVSITDIPADFEILLLPLPILADPDQYHLWHSKSEAQNYGGLNNPRIDKLLEDGRREMDFIKRTTIYEDFQKYLLDESIAIFLYYPASYSIFRK